MTDPGSDDQPVPLGFKLLVVAAGLYILLRVVEGVGWLLNRLG